MEPEESNTARNKAQQEWTPCLECPDNMFRSKDRHVYVDKDKNIESMDSAKSQDKEFVPTELSKIMYNEYKARVAARELEKEENRKKLEKLSETMYWRGEMRRRPNKRPK